MPFTDREKARILHHLGYPHFADMGLARGYGHPAAGPSADAVYDAFYRVSELGADAVRRVVAELECIEQDLAKLRPKASVTKASEVSFDVPAARRMLLSEQRRLVLTLSNTLGAPPNPYSRYGAGPRVREIP